MKPLPLRSHFHFLLTSTSISLPSHFHLTRMIDPVLPSTLRMRIPTPVRIVFKMLVTAWCVLSAFAVAVVESYVPPHSLQRNEASLEEIVFVYFHEGYSYKLILCFLAGVHGIMTSLRTLKRVLRKLGLRRRGCSSRTDLTRVGTYILVS